MTLQISGLSQTLRAVTDLRQRILDGDLPGGARLFEVHLAAELGISRTPVREAMARLAEEGLLDRAPGGGFVVREFTLADAVDAIELRGVLEGTAARLAAERGAPETGIATMRALLERIDAALDIGAGIDLQAYSDLNTQFHATLAGLCGSAVLGREIDRVTRLPFAAPSAFLPGGSTADTFPVSLIVAQSQHRALVEAIVAREGARAEAICREHARAARHNVERHFANRHRVYTDSENR